MSTDQVNDAWMKDVIFHAIPVFRFSDGWKSNSNSKLAAATGCGKMDFETHLVQGGQILDRENISTRRCWSGGQPNPGEDGWRADLDFQNGRMTLGKFTTYGRTRLQAGLRCWIASRLGFEVDVPAHLYCKNRTSNEEIYTNRSAI